MPPPFVVNYHRQPRSRPRGFRRNEAIPASVRRETEEFVRAARRRMTY